jgi:parvulin-like peptidyl-prolyl isomerase
LSDLEKSTTQPATASAPASGSEVSESQPSESSKKKTILHKPITRPANSIESAILMVNNDHITADEVIRRAKRELEATALTYNQSAFDARIDEIFSSTLRSMISEILLYQEVSARISEDDNPAVEKAVDKEVNNLVIREAGGSVKKLEKLLVDQGSTLDELRKQLRKQVVTQQYLREKMRPQVIVTRDDMWDYYLSHQNEYMEPTRIHLFLIEIDAEKYLPEELSWQSATSNQQKQATAAAEKVVSDTLLKLKKGEDFSKLAEKVSSGISARVGGDVGWISQGSYRLKRLEQVAFNLNKNQISDPIRIERKTYIIKVTEIDPGKNITFSDAQEEIKSAVESEVYRKLVNRHIAELWDKAQIGDVESFMKSVSSRIPTYESLRKDKPEIIKRP